MDKTIWKFPLEISDTIRLDMPLGAEVLSVQMQDGTPTLWALVEPAMPLTAYSFRVFGTGHPVPNGAGLDVFVGTLQMGPLVFHMFKDWSR